MRTVSQPTGSAIAIEVAVTAAARPSVLTRMSQRARVEVAVSRAWPKSPAKTIDQVGRRQQHGGADDEPERRAARRVGAGGRESTGSARRGGRSAGRRPRRSPPPSERARLPASARSSPGSRRCRRGCRASGGISTSGTVSDGSAGDALGERVLLRARGEERLRPASRAGERMKSNASSLRSRRLEHADAGQQQQRAEALRAGSRP